MAWFFGRARYGGILCDIGGRLIEQFLHFTGARDAQLKFAAARNAAHAAYPELLDSGECLLEAGNATSGCFRADWFTPDGLSAWGDGRLVIPGTEGYIELSNHADIATGRGMARLYLVDGQREHRVSCAGRVGFPLFGDLILDCLDGTENVVTQEHTFKAAEFSLLAQGVAEARPDDGAARCGGSRCGLA